tara:strand:- start:248349 stop:248807 length:459 start_codon:yes stop_codon:yes gene_type:complete
MLQNISNFFEKHLKLSVSNDAEEQTIDKIQLASAALMIELCKSDHSIDDLETNKIADILQTKFDLPEETLQDLMSLAQQEVDEATSLYQFTSLINESYDQPAKTALILNMWEVAYADGDLDRYEEHMIRKVSELLYVSHSDFIKTKLAAKQS